MPWASLQESYGKLPWCSLTGNWVSERLVTSLKNGPRLDTDRYLLVVLMLLGSTQGLQPFCKQENIGRSVACTSFSATSETVLWNWSDLGSHIKIGVNESRFRASHPNRSSVFKRVGFAATVSSTYNGKMTFALDDPQEFLYLANC